MPLRQRQIDALPVLEWLLDPTVRSSGRTLALAVAAIRTACRNPGVFVDIVDHARPAQARELLARVIQDMVRADFRLQPHFAMGSSFGTQAQFRLVLPNAIPDWMPTEAVLSGRAAAEMGRAAGERTLRDQERMRMDLVVEPYDPEMDMITPEMAERIDARLASLLPVEKKLNKVVEPKPKTPPQPKSAWERLLRDKD